MPLKSDLKTTLKIIIPDIQTIPRAW